MRRTSVSTNIIALLLGSAFGGFGVPQAGVPVQDYAPPPKPKMRRGYRYVPHQNVRECARRLGGRTWQLYKEADRARRGLEPLT
jgi:hypothetical protein